LDEQFRTQVQAVEELILAEVNVKALEYVSDSDGMFQKRAKANFKTLGRRLGKQMKAAADAIAELNSADIARFQREGRLELSINGELVELGPEDLEISTDDIPGWQVASDHSITVALDLTLSDELVAEGLARDLVNRVQNMRKSQDFNVTDRIVLRLEEVPALKTVIEQFGEYIQTETLADRIELVPGLNQGEAVELTDLEPLWAQVERV
jgi:isoleucyl-tRNA synthetase